MPTTLPRRNQRSSGGCHPTSRIALRRWYVDPLAYFESAAADGHFRLIHRTDLATVLIFSTVGLVVSISLNLLLTFSQQTSSLLAQFG